MQIHISQTTKDHLEHEPYIIEERGKIFVKVGPGERRCSPPQIWSGDEQ